VSAGCLPGRFGPCPQRHDRGARSRCRGEVRDGSFADSLVEVGRGYCDAAPGRAGTYAVHIEHGSYAAWDTSGIVVSSGGACPDLIETEQIEARLVPIE
jgi:hypothetical protein